MSDTAVTVPPESQPIVRSMVGVLPAGLPRAPEFSPRIGLRSLQSWAYSAAMLNANKVGSIPLRLYARKPKGRGYKSCVATRKVPKERLAYLCGDAAHLPSNSVAYKSSGMLDDMEEVTGPHPITDLLRAANPYTTGFDLVTMIALNLDCLADAYVAMTFGALGIPSELWRLPPQFTEVIPGRERLYEGYMFGRSRAEAIVIEPEEMIHFMGPRVNSVYYGAGKMEAAWSIVQQNAAMHEMDYALFSNHARPDYAVIIEDGASAEELKAFEDSMKSALRGTRKAGSFFTATGKVRIEPLNWPPKDVTGRDKIVEEIYTLFGTPVGFAMSNDPNRANAESQSYTWCANTILPTCRRIEETLNNRLTVQYDDADELMLAFDNPVPRNEEYELKEATALVVNGIGTPNEVRVKYFGMEPIEDDPSANELRNPTATVAPVPLDGQPATDEDGEPLPTTETTTGNAEAKTGAPGGIVQDAALNGAQVTALLELIRAVQSGEIPVEAGRLAALTAFPLVPEDRISAMFNAIEPREFVDPVAASVEAEENKPKEDEKKDDEEAAKSVLVRLAAMVDEHNKRTGDACSLVEALKSYEGAA